MNQVFPDLDVTNYRAHALHNPARAWPETNCYVDLWIELLSSHRTPPEAMLAFTVRQDFEGDHFTFFKTPLEDLEFLYDIQVTELAIFDDVERQTLTQIERGRMVLVEVDSFWLPDTRSLTYRAFHGKTTVGINSLDHTNKRMTYFHNAGYFHLEGEDYDGIFGKCGSDESAVRLFPYAEFAKFPLAARIPTVADSARRLEHHLAQRPRTNPFLEWQKAMPAQFEDLLERPEAYFHTYAFNTLRQIGANFELLASYLDWIYAASYLGLKAEIDAAKAISTAAKTMQFQLARAMARRKPQSLADMITPMAEAYDFLMTRLDARAGLKRAA